MSNAPLDQLEIAIYTDIWEKAFDPQLNGLYSWAMNFLSVLNTLSTGIVLWVLLRKTPAEMKHYKWFLLNVTLSAYAIDIWLSFFSKPLIIFTMPDKDVHGICVLGPLKYLQDEGAFLTYLVYVELLGFFGTSLAFAIIFRYLSIRGHEQLLLTKKANCIKALIQLLYSVPCVYTALNSYFEMKKEEQYMDKYEFAMWESLELQSCMFMDHSRLNSIFYISFVLLQLTVVSLIIAMTDHSLRKLRAMISADTYKYQKQLVFSLLLQFLVPAIFVTGGCLLSSSLVLARSAHVTYISRFCFFISSFHTTAHALTLILATTPYRRAIKEWILKFSKKIHPTSHTNINSS